MSFLLFYISWSISVGGMQLTDILDKDTAVPLDSGVVDYTKIPTQLDRKFEEFDESNALRPTIIHTGDTWHKIFHKSILSKANAKAVNAKVIVKTECA